MTDSTESLAAARPPQSTAGASPPGKKAAQRFRFRWPSPRTLLWLHIGVVCYTGAVVHLGIHDYLQMPGFNAEEASFPGEIAANVLIGAAVIGFFTIYLFPLAMVVSLYRSESSWRLTLCGVVEALLVYAHIAAIYPWAIHVY